MAGKNNAAVIAGIGKISTPRVTDGRSIDFAGAVDSFFKGYDWGDNLRKQKEQEANREALALALQAEDEAQIADAWAKFDPMGYAERLDKIKEARIKREQALADAETKYNRDVALEELKNSLGIKKDEAAHERTLALEKLKRDWSLEDKGLERQQQLEDAEAKRQDFYAQTAFEKDLEAQYDKEDIEKLPNALVYANELDKLDPNNPAHQPRIQILNGLLAKEMAISGGKTNVAKEIQVYNMFKELYPDMSTEQLLELSKSYLSQAKQQKDTMSAKQKDFIFYTDVLGMSKDEAKAAVLNQNKAPTGELGYLLSLKEKLDTNNPEDAEKLEAIKKRINVITKDPTVAMNYSYGQSYGEKLAKTREAYDTFVANLPNMENVIKSLYGYADDATYTMFGRAYDEVMKQLGGMSTEGSVAKAKFESTARAVLYPLLRPTFGSQFTENEGERLIALLGAAGQTPEEKKAVLVGFLTDYVNKMISNAEILKSAGVAMPDFSDDIKERILKYGTNPTTENVENIIKNNQNQGVKIKGIRRVK